MDGGMDGWMDGWMDREIGRYSIEGMNHLVDYSWLML
jgi:hypothetical protein